MRVDEARQDRATVDVDPRGRPAGAIARTAASPPTATIRSPTIATPPSNGGSPGRAVKTRPLTRTSPRITAIFAPGSVRTPHRTASAAARPGQRRTIWFPLRPGATMQPVRVEELARVARDFAEEEGLSMRSRTDLRVPRDHRDRRRMQLGRRWRHIGRSELGSAVRQLSRHPSESASASASAAESAACNPPKQDGVTLSFTSFGGVYQEAQRKAWLEPYTRADRRPVHRGRELVERDDQVPGRVRPGHVGRRRRRQRLRP